MTLQPSRPEDAATSPGVVALPANCATPGASDLRDTLCAGLAATDMVTVDAGGTEIVGQAAFQLLIAARAAADAAGQGFSLANASPALAARIASLQLADRIGLAAGKED